MKPFGLALKVSEFNHFYLCVSQKPPREVCADSTLKHIHAANIHAISKQSVPFFCCPLFLLWF